MNKKAIIFTLDALIALSIFVAVAIAMYSVLSPKPEINIQSSAIYMNSENFLRASDKAENFSQAFLKIQEGDTDAADALMSSLLEELPYPAEMRLSVYNESGNIVSSLTVNDQNFTTSIILRKFLVLTLTENLLAVPPPFMAVDMKSSKTPAAHEFHIIIMPHMPPVPLPQNCNVTAQVISSGGQQQSWPITLINPQSSEVNFNDYGDQPVDMTFNMDIPANAEIGEYRMQVDTTGNNCVRSGSSSFNIIQYGIIELEVQTS